MNIPEKIGYTLAFIVPLGMIAAILAPNFMQMEQRINYEQAMDDLILGLIGIFCLLLLIVIPVVCCIFAIVAIWLGELTS